MVDIVTITAISAGITGLVIAVLTHIRHSNCGCCSFDTNSNVNEVVNEVVNEGVKKNNSFIKKFLLRKQPTSKTPSLEEAHTPSEETSC